MPKITDKVEAYDIFNTSYTVANGNQISKGILLTLTSPRTASACTSADASHAVVGAGISAMDKEANDGSTTITAWTKGLFKGHASGAVQVGNKLCFVNDGYVTHADSHLLRGDEASKAIVIGTAMESVADNARIVFKLEL